MKLTWHRRKLHLKHPFNIARMARDDKTDQEVLLINITHGDLVGWGEAAPRPYYHQTFDSAEAMFEKAAGMLGKDPLAFDAILDPLFEKFPDQPAAICAIDAALHDLAGKLLGVPVWKLLGLEASRCPLTDYTIGIDDLDVIAEKVREAEEYPILKIKIGTPDDEKILSTVRREAPKKIIRVDANCGWNSANAMERCRLAARYNIEFVEQPTPAGEHGALPAIRAAKIVPLMADESCPAPADILKCIGNFDSINIKLSKCGGIRKALQMIHTARTAGLKIMIGCMVETSVGMAPAAHLGPMVDYLDLDGPLLLADDPFDGVVGTAGRLTLSDRPGLGIIEHKKA